MKSSTLVIVGSGTVLVLAITLYMCFAKPKEHNPTIAIFTTMSHPALDSVRMGFINGIKKHNPDLLIKDYNAEGNMQQANMLARQIAENKDIVAIVAIATLAAQSIAKVEKKRPLVIAAVSDPEAIIPKGTANNICGLTDAINANYQIDTILELLPQIKSISLLYSPHEDNSSSMVKKIHEAALKKQLRVNLVGVSEPQQIQSASIKACEMSDAVLIPLDNQLVASMPSITKATKDFSCPIITSNESPIHQGATLAFGVDYLQMGIKAAHIVEELLQHKTPQDIGFIYPSAVELYGNARVLQEKGLTLDEKALKIIIKVED